MADTNFTLTHQDIKEMFYYEDGNLYWKKHKRNCLVGKKVGYLQTNGYVRVNIKGKQNYLHRLIFFYHYGFFPANQIDHIDGDNKNNRIENLREATNLQNSFNKKKYNINTSGYKGVSWSKAAKKWETYITVNGKRKYLGLFKNIEDAHQVVSAVRKQVHVEFAKE